ncbi:hypothetical protein [Cumulibacter soli]|uniref:hypothetical protein n=1 Tax=Cumulibacter soli TaxID=2546344 RepID=UPI0010681C96|nr:hypothetical protein [Cumulibacter soli]
MRPAPDPRSDTHAPTRAGSGWLRAVPDADSTQLLGPQHAELTSFFTSVGFLTPEQDAAIESKWYDMRGPERFASRGQASQAASTHARLEEQLNARQRAWAATTMRARDAAGDAAHALSVRDLIGVGMSQEAYDELVAPWALVMGPVHPADTDPRSR